MKYEDWPTRPLDAHVRKDWDPIMAPAVAGVAGGRGARVLDYGCGFGRMAAEFDDYWGVDIAAHRIDYAKEAHPGKRFHAIDRDGGLAEMIDGGCFTDRDSIICCSVLMHIPDGDLPGVLTQFARLKGNPAALIIAEHMGRKWRKTAPNWAFNRELDEVRDLLSGDWDDVEARPFYNPRYKEDLWVIRAS